MRALGFVVVAAFGCTPLPTSEVNACTMQCIATDEKIKECGIVGFKYAETCIWDCCRQYTSGGIGRHCDPTLSKLRAEQAVTCVDEISSVKCFDVVAGEAKLKPIVDWTPDVCEF